MKLPNGYGSVHKLSGKRRNPWRVRKTDKVVWYNMVSGETFDAIPENADVSQFKAKQTYINIGYYATQKEALQVLADYNANPYDVASSKLTFSEVYELWLEEHARKVSKSNITGVKASYKLCVPIYDLTLSEIKLGHLQSIVDKSGKNTPTLKKLKIMLGLVFDYGVKHEIIPPQKREMVSYLDISKAGNPNALNRVPFTTEEIKTLWKHSDNNTIRIILTMIYSGVRISELLELKCSDVHLDERYFYVRESKTKSGIREVPIAEKIVPFFNKWLDGEYLIDKNGLKFNYDNFYKEFWNKTMQDLGMEHKPHDTRHTCISLLVSAGVDDRIIKKIVGHKGEGVTEVVYTHVDLPDKLTAINKITVG